MTQRVVLVTGGSRGIGAAIVKRFAADGSTVYFTYRSSAAEAERLAGSFKNVKAMACDSRDREAVDETVSKIVEAEERLDVLVNNAGVIRDGLFLTMSGEDWAEVLETNLAGTAAFCKAVCRQMLAQRSGSIVNVSSIVGELGGFGQANYAASKGAVNAFTKSLASEFGSRNITVNAVAPGMVKTEMTDAVRSLYGDKIKERIPLARFAEPEDVAAAVYFLASEEARYITGQVLSVDGGLTLLGRK